MRRTQSVIDYFLPNVLNSFVRWQHHVRRS